MSKSPQSAAGKAAAALVARQAEAQERQSGEQAQTGGDPQTDPPPPPPPLAAPAKGKAKEETRSFVAVHNVTLSGVPHPPGSTIEITQGEHASLAAFGSVARDWDDDED